MEITTLRLKFIGIPMTLFNMKECLAKKKARAVEDTELGL